MPGNGTHALRDPNSGGALTRRFSVQNLSTCALQLQRLIERSGFDSVAACRISRESIEFASGLPLAAEEAILSGAARSIVNCESRRQWLD